MHKQSKKARKALRNLAKMPGPAKVKEHRHRINARLETPETDRKPPRHVRWMY